MHFLIKYFKFDFFRDDSDFPFLQVLHSKFPIQYHHVKKLFVNRFSKLLRHILGQMDC